MWFGMQLSNKCCYVLLKLMCVHHYVRTQGQRYVTRVLLLVIRRRTSGICDVFVRKCSVVDRFLQWYVGEDPSMGGSKDLYHVIL